MRNVSTQCEMCKNSKRQICINFYHNRLVGVDHSFPMAFVVNLFEKIWYFQCTFLLLFIVAAKKVNSKCLTSEATLTTLSTK